MECLHRRPGIWQQCVDCTTASDGACSEKFTINQTTATDWIMQFYQSQSLVAGQTYVLTFDAKASSQRNADVYLQQNHGDHYLLSDTVPYTIYPTWNHYTIELTSSDTDTNARIDFNTLASALGNVWFDNVHLFPKRTTKFSTPHFTGIYDSTGTSTASAYQIQVIQRGGNWASPLWDTGKTTLSPQTAIGARTATSTYAGTSLPSDGTDANKYFWRMKVWNQSDSPSPWTNGNDYFFTPGNRVQDLSYTYDANGNITRLVDASFTKTAKVVDYTYDTLNRLTQASTTADISSGAPNAGHNMIEQWGYDVARQHPHRRHHYTLGRMGYHDLQLRRHQLRQPRCRDRSRRHLPHLRQHRQPAHGLQYHQSVGLAQPPRHIESRHFCYHNLQLRRERQANAHRRRHHRLPLSQRPVPNRQRCPSSHQARLPQRPHHR